MRVNWRTAAGGVCGVAGAAIWAVCLAVYQPRMQPHGTFLDPNDGTEYPNLASNNTYWPRELRELAILLALAGVLVVCRARPRGLAVAAASTVAWLGMDLWLDRLDVAGWPTAGWLAAAGVAWFGLTATVAARVGGPDRVGLRQVAAGAAATLAVLGTVVTTPWGEPVVLPEQVAVENAVTALKAVLAGLLVIAAVALANDRLATARGRLAAAELAIVVGIAWLLTALDGGTTAPLVLLAPIAALLAVAGPTDVSARRLALAAVGCLAAGLVSIVVALLVGVTLGGGLTALAANPVVNGADTDLAIALPSLLVGLILGAVAYGFTRPMPQM